MARLRVADLSASVPGKLRIANLSASGVVSGGVGRLRIGDFKAAGTIQVALVPFADIGPIEPLTTVTLTAATAAGSPTPTTYTWEIVAGSLGGAATLTGTGNTRSFVAPTDPDLGGYVDVRVKGTYSGTDSPWQQVRVTIYPHLFYTLTGGRVAMKPFQFL